MNEHLNDGINPLNDGAKAAFMKSTPDGSSPVNDLSSLPNDSTEHQNDGISLTNDGIVSAK